MNSERKTNPIFLPALLLLLVAALLCGCQKTKRYDYHQVKRQYTRPPASKEQPPKPPELKGEITLRQAIGHALEYNPDVDIALARIRRSEAMVDLAGAGFWPMLSLYTDISQGDAPSAYLFKTIDQRALPPGVDFNDPGHFQNTEIGVRAGWNLFRGGRDLLAVDMAETGLAMSRLDRRAVVNALAASITMSYYNALAAADMVDIAKASVETVSTEVRLMKVRYKAGGALKSDVLSLEVRLAQARESLVNALNSHRLALAALANLMGADLDSEFRLKKGQGVFKAIPASYGQGMTAALKLRPELAKARRQVVQARMALDQAESEYLPTIDARAVYYLADESLDFDLDRANWTGGLLLNWDVFTGFSTKSRANKSGADLSRMLAADRKLTRKVQLEVKSAYLNLEAAKARQEVSRASRAQAEESLKLVTRQYEGGSATVTRYLDAELALSRARVRAAAARHDTEKAKADIARALGLWAEFARNEGEANAK